MSQWLTDLASVAVRYEGTIDHTGDDEARLQALVDDAEQELTDRVPDLAARITSDLVTLGTVQAVLRTAVLRAWRNPGGLRTEAAGEVSVGRAGVISDSVTFTSHELARVTGSAGRRAGTIGMSPAAPLGVAL